MGSKGETDRITSVLESYSFVVYNDIRIVIYAIEKTLKNVKRNLKRYPVGIFSFFKNTNRQYEGRTLGFKKRVDDICL